MLSQLFEQVQTYVEEFDETKSARPSETAVRQLEVLASDSIPRALFRTADAVLILQAVLTRWIIHRISGRSTAEESILPPEVTAIPQKNQWHMECNQGEPSTSAEDKRGMSIIQTYAPTKR